MITRHICCNHTLGIIVLAPFIIFQTYNIISYNISCDCSHMPLHYPKNKIKEKDKLN